jgi:hypothetical protein
MTRPTRRWPRAVGWSLGALALVLILPALWAELQPHAPPPAMVAARAESSMTRLYVVDWGYHTAIVIAQPPHAMLGPPDEPASRFVEFAWGDRRFYMESRYAPHSLFATIFLPTEAVMYVAGRAVAPERPAGARSVYARDITVAEWSALARELERWIRHDSSGSRLPAFPSVTGYAGRFYPAHGAYLWWTDCNRWTLDRLAAAGLARSGRGVILSGQVPGRLLGFRRISPGT